MDNSIVFSANKTERINEYIANNIDCRLYLFAYYNPKIAKSNSIEHCFWCAVTNLYGLFRDCASFLDYKYLLENGKSKISMLEFWEHKKILGINDRIAIENFINLICSLRSLFCHNAHIGYPYTENDFYIAYNFFTQYSSEYIDGLSNIDSININEDEWKECLNYICTEADKNYELSKCAIKRIASHQDKEEFIEWWMLSISKWYINQNSLLFNASNLAYDYLCTEASKKPGPNKRKCITYWKNNFFDEWKGQYVAEVKNSNEPALPLYIATLIVLKNKPIIWD